VSSGYGLLGTLHDGIMGTVKAIRCSFRAKIGRRDPGEGTANKIINYLMSHLPCWGGEGALNPSLGVGVPLRV